MKTLQEQKEEFIKHYGVKGMKWGTRRRYSPDGSRPLSRSEAKAANMEAKARVKANKALAKSQKKYDKKFDYLTAYNAAADKVNSGKSPLIIQANKKISALLDKEGTQSIETLSSSGQKKFDKIMDDYMTKFSKLVEETAVEIYGERPS